MNKSLAITYLSHRPQRLTPAAFASVADTGCRLPADPRNAGLIGGCCPQAGKTPGKVCPAAHSSRRMASPAAPYATRPIRRRLPPWTTHALRSSASTV